MSDPMWENPTEPRTKAGRRLIAAFPGNAADASSPAFIRHMAQCILAIEQEAAAPSPALTREALALAVTEHEPRVGGYCDSGIYLECECGWDNFLDGTYWSEHFLAATTQLRLLGHPNFPHGPNDSSRQETTPDDTIGSRNGSRS